MCRHLSSPIISILLVRRRLLIGDLILPEESTPKPDARDIDVHEVDRKLSSDSNADMIMLRSTMGYVFEGPCIEPSG